MIVFTLYCKDYCACLAFAYPWFADSWNHLTTSAWSLETPVSQHNCRRNNLETRRKYPSGELGSRACFPPANSRRSTEKFPTRVPSVNSASHGLLTHHRSNRITGSNVGGNTGVASKCGTHRPCGRKRTSSAIWRSAPLTACVVSPFPNKQAPRRAGATVCATPPTGIRRDC